MLKFSHVTKKFGDQLALDDLSFDLTAGEMVLLTGKSGSGKTTILKLITKEYLPSEGEILFNDTPLAQIKYSKVHEHRRHIGMVFQDYKLLNEYNVWENIALPLEIIGTKEAEIESRVTDLLKLVELTEKAELFPSQLSGGEAQRVGIARALATAPGLILADEPTGNLDTETTQNIVKLFETINKLGTTILLATHDVGVLNSLPQRRHLHLDQGKIKTEDKKQEKSKKSKDQDESDH